jgi:hypothetical protein
MHKGNRSEKSAKIGATEQLLRGGRHEPIRRDDAFAAGRRLARDTDKSYNAAFRPVAEAQLLQGYRAIRLTGPDRDRPMGLRFTDREIAGPKTFVRVVRRSARDCDTAANL